MITCARGPQNRLVMCKAKWAASIEDSDRTELSGSSETDVSQHAQIAAARHVFKI